MMLICQKNFRRSSISCKNFSKYIIGVTISAREELERNSKAINQRVVVLYSGGCMCIKEIILYKSVATSKRKSLQEDEESGTKTRV